METSTTPIVNGAGQGVPTSGLARLTALIVACALFMQNLDSTVIATALPTMARAFGSEPIRMNVALTSYLLSLTVFIPASGWVADRYGARSIFRAAIAVFTAGSVLCGVADSLAFLVAARIVQGIGGAMMVPVGRLVLLRTVARHELVAVMAWLTMPALLGPVLGPPVGGFIVTYWSWRWIFFINIPIGLLGMVLVTAFIHDAPQPRPGRLDLLGLILSGTALAGLIFGFDTAGRGVVSPLVTAALLLGGSVAAVAFGWHVRRHPRPLLDFTLLRVPTFAVSVGAGTLFRIGIQSIPFLLPLMLQLGFGASAAKSGAITFASSAGALIMKPVAQRVLRRFGFRRTLIWNGFLSSAALALYAAFRPGWPVACIYAVLLTGGFLRSLQFTAYNTLAYADVPPSRMSAATSLFTTVQQLSQVLGVAVGASVLEISMWLHGYTSPQLSDFTAAFLAVSLLSLGALPLNVALAGDAGDELTGADAGSR